jgi:hypothetical protein
MGSGHAQSLTLYGFGVAYFGVVRGLFLLTTEVADHGRVLLVSGVIFLVGTGMITVGNLRERRDRRDRETKG